MESLVQSQAQKGGTAIISSPEADLGLLQQPRWRANHKAPRLGLLQQP